MLNHSVITNYSYDLTIVKEFINEVCSNDNLYSSLNLWKIAASTLYKVITKQPVDSGDYFAFKNQLFQEKDILNIEELRN